MANNLGAIGINDNGIDSAEDGLIFRPTIDDGSMNIEATLFVEGCGEELAASVEFMFTRLVGSLTSQKEDSGGRCSCGRKPKGNRSEHKK